MTVNDPTQLQRFTSLLDDIGVAFETNAVDPSYEWGSLLAAAGNFDTGRPQISLHHSNEHLRWATEIFPGTEGFAFDAWLFDADGSFVAHVSGDQ